MDEATLIKRNEMARLVFFSSFQHASTFTADQLEGMSPDSVAQIEHMVKLLLWEAMQRRSMISSGGQAVEEYLNAVEEDIPEIGGFVRELCTEKEVESIEKAIWCKMVRLVSERNLTNAMEIVELYDSERYPYFAESLLD